MSIKPIDHSISALNTVHEAKNQHEQHHRGSNINAFMQDNVQSEVERNKSKVIHSDASQGSLVDEDGQQKNDRQHQKNKKKKNPSEKKATESYKGNRLDIRI
ncbi:hypothetical protein [Anoxynatronum sibiricum]|uniref:Uncharacterized protein n=1 Tax=Anoxynatronum sibiricum TaxID=210623 RepID=A0ABU9VQG8_9CLOT